MKKKILLALAVVAVAVLAWIFRPPSAETRIRRRLDCLTAALHKDAETKQLQYVGKVSLLTDLFVEDCVVAVGAPVPAIEGRERLRGAFLSAMRIIDRLDVDFADVTVTVDPDGTTAGVVATATAAGERSGGQDAFEAREVEMDWALVDDAWRIRAIRRVEVLR